MKAFNFIHTDKQFFSTMFATTTAAVLATALTAFTANNAYADETVNTFSADNAEHAKLIIYRDEGLKANSKMYYRVWVDGDYKGKLKASTAFHMHLEPGTHVIETNDAEEQSIEVTVTAGGTTYVSAEIDKHYDVSLSQRQPHAAMVAQLNNCDASFNHRCDTSAASCCAGEVESDRYALR